MTQMQPYTRSLRIRKASSKIRFATSTFGICSSSAYIAVGIEKLNDIGIGVETGTGSRNIVGYNHIESSS